MIISNYRRLKFSYCKLLSLRFCPLMTDATEASQPPPSSIARENIVLVDNPISWKQAITELERETVVGFDTESKPAIAPKIQSYRTFLHRTSPHLIQLATREKAYLFSTLDSFEDKSEIRKQLSNILENDDIIKVGFDLRNDLQFLSTNYGIMMRNYVDLSVELSSRKGLVVGLPDAVQVYMNVSFKKNKNLTLSNWAIPLSTYSESMLLYAANDAFMALHVFDAWALDGKVKRSIERLDRLFEEQQQKKQQQVLFAQRIVKAASSFPPEYSTSNAESSPFFQPRIHMNQDNSQDSSNRSIIVESHSDTIDIQK